MISPLYFEKILFAWCFAITKHCSRLSSLHNVKNKAEISGIEWYAEKILRFERFPIGKPKLHVCQECLSPCINNDHQEYLSIQKTYYS